MLERKNTGYFDGYFSLVAGHLDGNETVVTAAIREAREEIGVEIFPKDVEVTQVLHRKSDDERIDFFVRIHAWDGEICNNEIEKWFDKQNNKIAMRQKEIQKVKGEKESEYFATTSKAEIKLEKAKHLSSITNNLLAKVEQL